MELAHAHVLVDGRVQGVFYRAFVKSVAERLCLDGWVKNLFDGRVEAVFEGKRSSIDEAIRECRKGPPSSHVTDVTVIWEDFSGKLQGFEIRY